MAHHLSPKQAFPNDKTVTAHIRHPLIISLPGYRTVRFEAGLQEVPESLRDHWYLKPAMELYKPVAEPVIQVPAHLQPNLDGASAVDTVGVTIGNVTDTTGITVNDTSATVNESKPATVSAPVKYAPVTPKPKPTYKPVQVANRTR